MQAYFIDFSLEGKIEPQEAVEANQLSIAENKSWGGAEGVKDERWR